MDEKATQAKTDRDTWVLTQDLFTPQEHKRTFHEFASRILPYLLFAILKVDAAPREIVRKCQVTITIHGAPEDEKEYRFYYPFLSKGPK